ncbi:uncharacterized protein LOC119569197 [Penaeus monodon]|uniref:uncharacterized protein LOC119569197 n=1 Tax=Penaeus monodon TaxID=6687 RepID=UPI0018A75262|nr:uncharacterized protein LOC119569197 [Penaeus monodon]
MEIKTREVSDQPTKRLVPRGDCAKRVNINFECSENPDLMDSDLNSDPGENPESIQYMDHENQTKRTREELESDNEENPISKQPKNKEAGWKAPEEPQPTTSNNQANMEVQINHL